MIQKLEEKIFKKFNLKKKSKIKQTEKRVLRVRQLAQCRIVVHRSGLHPSSSRWRRVHPIPILRRIPGPWRAGVAHQRWSPHFNFNRWRSGAFFNVLVAVVVVHGGGFRPEIVAAGRGIRRFVKLLE